jgi:hypothetical protein
VIVFFPLNLQPGAGVPVRVGTREALGYDTLWLDPVSGEELGRTDSNAVWPTRSTLVDWLYLVHRQLAIPGRWGGWILGILQPQRRTVHACTAFGCHGKCGAVRRSIART